MSLVIELVLGSGLRQELEGLEHSGSKAPTIPLDTLLTRRGCGLSGKVDVAGDDGESHESLNVAPVAEHLGLPVPQMILIEDRGRFAVLPLRHYSPVVDQLVQGIKVEELILSVPSPKSGYEGTFQNKAEIE